MKLRVLVIGRPRSRMSGYGVERYTTELVSALMRHGVQVNFIGDWGPVAWLAGRLPAHGPKISAVLYDIVLPFFFLLTKKCREAHVVHLVDVVHVFPAVVLGKLLNPRMIVTVQSLNGITYLLRNPEVKSLGDSLYATQRVLGLRLARRLIRRFVAVSNTLSEDIRRILPSLSVVVIHPFLSNYQKRERVGASDLLTLGCVGALVPGKRVERAIRLVDVFRKWGVDCRLIICGSGPSIGKLRKLVDELTLSSRITFVGHVGKNMANYYERFDFLIFPSRAESFGYPIVEAASHGVPSITFSEANLAQEVKMFTLVAKDVSDAARIILSLWKDPKSYLEFSRKVADSAQQYAGSYSILNLVNLYSNVTSSVS